MHVLAPFWLLALVPWLAVALWLLSGSRQRVHVPFLPLWQGRVERLRTRRRIHLPPTAIAFLLAAVFLAILAAVHPQMPKPHNQIHGDITFIVDRGITMSAHGRSDLRFREAAGRAIAALRERFADCEVKFVSIPGDEPETLGLDQCDKEVKQLTPTALDTRELLAAAIRQSSPPALVISDGPLDAAGDGAIEVPPPQDIQDVSIVRFAAREQPIPEVMVGVRNQSRHTTAMLVVTSDQQRIQKQIELPSAPAEKNYFVDFPRLGSIVAARLEIADNVGADKQAWLVREGAGVDIEPHFAISPELRRLVDVYSQSRPPGPGAQHLPIVHDVSEVPNDAPAAIEPSPSHPLNPSEVHAQDHPVTHNVNWQALRASLDIAADPPPAGWTTLVDGGGRPLVAIRPTPPSQVWVGFDSPQWAATADFVIFWTNIFDWTGGASKQMAAHPLRKWTSQWKPAESRPSEPWPGVYRRSDGALRAFNAPDVPIPPIRDTRWQEAIAALATEPGRFDLVAPLLIAALACLLGAGFTWAAPTGRTPAFVQQDVRGNAKD